MLTGSIKCKHTYNLYTISYPTSSKVFPAASGSFKALITPSVTSVTCNTSLNNSFTDPINTF